MPWVKHAVLFLAQEGLNEELQDLQNKDEKLDQVHANDIKDTYSVELIGKVVEHNVKVTFKTGPGAG